MPVKLPNLGSGRTTCTVLVCRHDRVPTGDTLAEDFPATLDISSYVNNVSLSTNIYGGGSGSISVIPAFAWEDEIAANDIINIYLNTNRKNEGSVYERDPKTGKSVDNTWRYNKGNVRVFFGYVDHVSKSVSVGGVGTRVTSYAISFSSFDKAIKATTIYSNPNLAFQSDNARDTVRPDIANNLGGLILIQKGFPVAGSPRHLILAHLFRTLGFAGQWILPESYSEDMSPPQVAKNNRHFVPWKVKWERKTRGKEELELGMFKYYWSPTLQQPQNNEKSEGVPVCYNTSFKYFPADSEGKRSAVGSNAKADFKDALTLVGESGKMVDIFDRASLQRILLEYAINNNFKEGQKGAIRDLTSRLILFGNQTFWYGGGLSGAPTSAEMFVLSHLGTPGPTKVTPGVIKTNPEHKSTLIKLDYSKDFWTHYFETKTPQLTPLVNHTINPQGRPKPAKTLFNILCLDYMEDVDGNYVMSEMYNFGGPLYSQIQRQSNDLVAELFFDLRVSPDFEEQDKDGLGVDLDGAIPVVPAVIHREKPFTNYPATQKAGNRKTKSAENKTKVSIMPFAPPDKATPYLKNMTADQYELRVGGLHSFRSLLGTKAGYKDRIAGRLKKITGVEPVEITGKIISNAAANKRAKNSNGKELLSKSSTIMIAGSAEQVITYQAKINGVTKTLASKPYALTFTLPRPVFRSPDNDRITQELKISSIESIFGFILGKGTKTQFVAFGTDSPTQGMTVSNDPLKEGTWVKGKDNTYRTVKGGHKHVFTTPYSGLLGDGRVASTKRPVTWHVLDYMTIRNEDIISESYTRGDMQISNIRELHMDFLVGFDVQRGEVADILPIITPVSIYRNGVRIAKPDSTSFLQYLIAGGTDSRSWHQSLGLRWAIMLDMWEQHNHEYLTGNVSMRGMPGLRVGYRIDRKELNLSFYVNAVSHSWEYPGMMVTQVTVSRGQPMKAGDALPYYGPEPWVPANQQQRIELGGIFRASRVSQGEQLGAGALINLKTQIKDLKWPKDKK